MKTPQNKTDAEKLRIKAEELLNASASLSVPPGTASPLSEVEWLRVTHELKVHQIELELQNEELMAAKKQAKAAADRYFALYDFAPCGYFVLSREGEIIDINLSGAKMLGKERLLLKSKKFDFFVSDEVKPTFNSFLEKIVKSKYKEDCEVTMLATGTLPVYVYLTGIYHENEDRCLITMTDITHHKLAEISLRQSDEKFRIITENTNDVIALLDMDFNITYLSPSVEKVRGYTVEEAITQKPEQILTPASLKKFLEMAGNIIPAEKAGTAQVSVYPSIELEQYHKNGSTRWVELSFSFLKDFTNKSTGIVTVSRDVTKRKKVEDAMRQSEELYKSLISNSSELIILTDTKGITTFCSPQCEKVLGYPGDKFIGKIMPDIIHPDDVDRCQEAWENVFHKGQELEDFEYRIVDAQGGVRWVSHSVKMVGSDDPPVGLQNTIRNITDRKIAEEVIRVSEEKYRTMLNASPDGMVLINLKGIIIEVSVIGLNLFGADARVDMVGRNLSQFVPAEENNILTELLAKTTDEGLTQNTGLTIKRKDQSIFAGEISATLMQDQNGVPISFMIIVRDISQRKKMEAKQIHIDRMSTLGEMAAGIAHEINQPLNIISMVMDKILFETVKTETVGMEFLKNKSDKIFENITRIRDIIDHVRTFSRSQDDYIPTAFNVNSSIMNASSMVVEQFKHNSISLNLQLEPQMPQIVGNTYKFEQVILNLLTNAKDAVTEKKNQQQDVEMQVGIRSWHENQFIFVEVTDNGTGISKDDIHNVMLPFYTTKEEGKGTGLGLSICYQIIKEMNGTIEIASDRELGTKFQLVLPLQKKK